MLLIWARGFFFSYTLNGIIKIQKFYIFEERPKQEQSKQEQPSKYMVYFELEGDLVMCDFTNILQDELSTAMDVAADMNRRLNGSGSQSGSLGELEEIKR